MGPEGQEFNLHKELLCSVSDFFTAAFDGGFKETEEGVLKLPDQSVETFKYFMHWLYKGKLTGYFRPFSSPPITHLETISNAYASVYESTKHFSALKAKNESYQELVLAIFEEAPFHQLVSLYVFAETLQVRGLKDNIVSLIVKVYGLESHRCQLFWPNRERLSSVPDPKHAINHAYRQLPEKSLLKGVMVQLYRDWLNFETINSDRGSLEYDFVYDTLESFFRFWSCENSGPMLWMSESAICDYHEHDVPCVLKSRGIDASSFMDW